MERINRSVHRISSIIKSLRNLSRNSTRDDFEQLDIFELINDSLALLQEKIHLNGIKMEIDVDFNHTTVSGKLSEITQVLMNLVNNAIDALIEADVEEKRVSVFSHMDPTGQWIDIDVIDSGPGVPDDLKQKIFDPFFTTKEVGKGTGIGLSLSKKIMDTHGGKLILENEKQSKFIMRLPANREESKKAA
jgi:signal transduction histidine kinase